MTYDEELEYTQWCAEQLEHELESGRISTAEYNTALRDASNKGIRYTPLIEGEVVEVFQAKMPEARRPTGA